MLVKSLSSLAGVAALIYASNAVAGGPVLAPASDGPNFDFRGCILYEHINYGGHKFTIRGSYNLSYVGSRWNDKVSSIACHPKCNITVYEHRDFAGRSFVFGYIGNPNTKYVGDDWNDRVSSAKIRCFS